MLLGAMFPNKAFDNDPAEIRDWARAAENWRGVGATHVTLYTAGVYGQPPAGGDPLKHKRPPLS